MKTSFLTIVFISAFALLQSCGDDSKDVVNHKAKFVGQWAYVSKEYFECTNTDENKLYECGNNDAFGFCLTDIVFKENGEYFYSSDPINPVGYWSANQAAIGFYDDFYYTLNDNVVTLVTIDADVSSGCKQRIVLTKVL